MGIGVTSIPSAGSLPPAKSFAGANAEPSLWSFT
jgi:hypothetical protein